MPRRAVARLFAVIMACCLCAPCVPAAAQDHALPYLLSQPDLSSPRATLQALLRNGEIVVRDFMERGPGWGPRPAVRRMIDTLDTTNTAAEMHMLTRALAAIRLALVLQRLSPDLDGVPDAAAVHRDGIRQWRVPGTPITLARVEDGPRAGQFLFTPETVARSLDLYTASKQLSGTNGGGPDALERVGYAPGPLIPAWLIEHLPSPFHRPVAGQAVWQWCGLFLTLLLATLLVVKVTAWGVRHDGQETRPWRRYGHSLAALTFLAASASSLAFTLLGLKIWGEAVSTIIAALRIVILFAATWFAIASIQRVADVIVRGRGLRGGSIDAQLIKVVSTLICIAVGLTSGFIVADELGIPVGPLLAGLGIGGLAIALAVRPTLENVIGGLTLFADRPARVGEFCRFGSESGTVEDIGLRTTKIRKLDDTLVTIPNAELAQIRIENITRRRKFLYNPRLGLRYETTAEQLQTIAREILAMLAQHPKVLDEGPRVRLAGFGDYALNLDVFAYVDEQRLANFVAVQEDLNLAIMDIVKKAGASFAFPSQTTYLARDPDSRDMPGIENYQAMSLPR
ncbi:MAG: mechanosensitive ion channel family protein [Acetobacteraceae bacterium]